MKSPCERIPFIKLQTQSKLHSISSVNPELSINRPPTKLVFICCPSPKLAETHPGSLTKMLKSGIQSQIRIPGKSVGAANFNNVPDYYQLSQVSTIVYIMNLLSKHWLTSKYAA